jgi:hypothetical protein
VTTPEEPRRPKRPVPPGHEKIGRLTLPVGVAALLRVRAEEMAIAPITLAREILAVWAREGGPPPI